MEDFLKKDYEVPVTVSGYMKLEDGENVFRTMSSAVIGYEYWNTENKPVRSKELPENPSDIRLDKDDNPTKIKHFWAFVVWNYKHSKIQILQITQKTIMGGIQALVQDADWGNPDGYDIKITREGEGLETKYTVSPKPHSKVAKEVTEAYNTTPIDLQQLFNGGDPFGGERNDKATAGEDVLSADDIPFN